MSPRRSMNADDILSFPRVSGDEPIVRSFADQNTLFSPRERG